MSRFASRTYGLNAMSATMITCIQDYLLVEEVFQLGATNKRIMQFLISSKSQLNKFIAVKKYLQKISDVGQSIISVKLDLIIDSLFQELSNLVSKETALNILSEGLACFFHL